MQSVQATRRKPFFLFNSASNELWEREMGKSVLKWEYVICQWAWARANVWQYLLGTNGSMRSGKSMRCGTICCGCDVGGGGNWWFCDALGGAGIWIGLGCCGGPPMCWDWAVIVDVTTDGVDIDVDMATDVVWCSFVVTVDVGITFGFNFGWITVQCVEILIRSDGRHRRARKLTYVLEIGYVGMCFLHVPQQITFANERLSTLTASERFLSCWVFRF